MRVRAFRPGDEAELAQIFFSAVHEVASARYSPRQVKAWAPEMPSAEQFAVRAADGRAVFVAVDEQDRPLPYGDLEPDGHTDNLYCRPASTGAGVAAAVYEAIEAAAWRSRIGLLFVEASEPARRFFLKRGFELVARRDFKLDGVPVHNIRMEKRLARPGTRRPDVPHWHAGACRGAGPGPDRCH